MLVVGCWCKRAKETEDMGRRYGKGKRGRKNWGKRWESRQQLSHADWQGVERYLEAYRDRALEIHGRQGSGPRPSGDGQENIISEVVIGSHTFAPLTDALCSRPYIDLPHTLDGKERKRVHELCSFIDLYHAGAGVDDKHRSNAPDDAALNNNKSGTAAKKRRVSVSVFADGLDHVPDLEVRRSDIHSWGQLVSKMCRPWYLKAKGENSSEEARKRAIELEKGQIREFVRLPETSVRGANNDESCMTKADLLDMNELEKYDLSKVPGPDQTPWMLVDSIEKLKVCVHELKFGLGGDHEGRRPIISELAFDLEMHSVGDGRTTSQSAIRTCLIQLTSSVFDEEGGTTRDLGKDFVIDPLAPGVWDAIPSILGPIFADPSVVKIGHAIGGMDTKSLHQDFGILVVNAFDTYESCRVLMGARDGGLGLAKLCRRYGLPDWEKYQALKNRYQKSDWRMRPLDDGALTYGRYDVRYLCALRRLLMRDLVGKDMLGCPTLSPSVFDSRVDSDEFDHGDSFEDEEDDETPPESSLGYDNEYEVDDAQLLSSSDGASRSVQKHSTLIHASLFPSYQHLMKAIAVSQRRCLKLWDGKDDEPMLKNPLLLSLIKDGSRSRGRGKHWSAPHMKLYMKLVHWRYDTAEKEQVHVSEVCSLDVLVYTSYKLPKNRSELKRFVFVLPKLLDLELPHGDEFFRIVITSDAFSIGETRSPDAVYYRAQETVSTHGDTLSRDTDETDNGKYRRPLQLLVASLLSVCTVAIVLSRYKKRQ